MCPPKTLDLLSTYGLRGQLATCLLSVIEFTNGNHNFCLINKFQLRNKILAILPLTRHRSQSVYRECEPHLGFPVLSQPLRTVIFLQNWSINMYLFINFNIDWLAIQGFQTWTRLSISTNMQIITIVMNQQLRHLHN